MLLTAISQCHYQSENEQMRADTAEFESKILMRLSVVHDFWLRCSEMVNGLYLYSTSQVFFDHLKRFYTYSHTHSYTDGRGYHAGC